MSASISYWTHQLYPDFGEGMSRRADELYDIDDALMDDDGLIECAILPVRDVIVFPNMVTPLFVDHEPTLSAIEEAARTPKR